LCSKGTKCEVYPGAGDDDDDTPTVLGEGMTPLLLTSSVDIVLSGGTTPLLLTSSVDTVLSGGTTPLLLTSSVDIKTPMVSQPPQT
jgi:hypothetical protein